MGQIFVSEPELLAALDYLSRDSRSCFARGPKAWSRKRLIEFIEAALPKRPSIGSIFQVSAGVYGLVQGVGTDLLHGDQLEGLQVWLLVRPARTDISNMVPLSVR